MKDTVDYDKLAMAILSAISGRGAKAPCGVSKSCHQCQDNPDSVGWNGMAACSYMANVIEERERKKFGPSVGDQRRLAAEMWETAALARYDAHGRFHLENLGLGCGP